MASALKLVKRSLRLAGVLDPGEEPEGSEGTDAMEAMNQMLASWEEDGISLGYAPPGGLSETVKLPDWSHRGVVYNLAMELFTEYQVPVRPEVAAIADMEMRKLERTSIPINPRNMSHLTGNRNTFDINTGE